MQNQKKAFTLTELLVVVIVLGVLAAVAVPKFSRVLETRKTTEAEEIFSAVRTEQESRCALGKNYLTDKTKLSMMSGADNSANYRYTLTGQGIAAASGKGYTLKMLSYKDGQICCEGEYCGSLNKNYPSCTGISVNLDECAGEVAPEPEPGPCDIDPTGCACNPNQAKCCSSSEKWDGEACVAKTFCDLNPQDCSCNPNQAKCCAADETWNAQSGQCEETCKESTTVIDKITMADIIKGNVNYTDDCDKTPTSSYTCDGVFNGTCTDIAKSGLNYSVRRVTCCGTGGLGDFKPAEGFCSPLEQLQCTRNGGTWNSSTCKCTYNVDTNPDRDPVEPGGSMLRWQCTETSNCWIPSNATGTECSPEGSRAPLLIGVGPTGYACYLQCTCVKYFKQ